MIGWRAGLRVIVPSKNVVLEPDLYRMLPKEFLFISLASGVAKIRRKNDS